MSALKSVSTDTDKILLAATWRKELVGVVQILEQAAGEGLTINEAKTKYNTLSWRM